MITTPNVKINLGLHVKRKREDGFHELETLFIPYQDIHDTLEIIKGDDFSRTSAALAAKYRVEDGTLVQGISENGKLMITIARAEGVDWNPMKDLCARAYDMLDKDFNLPPVKIFLEKTSPVGAGLGGGSADAAFALRMLSDLFELGLTDDTLAGYASRLGSDCAFFVYNRPMMGRGRGEILTPYDIDLSSWDLQVVTPEGISVSTAEAYGGIVPQDGRNLEDDLSKGVLSWKDCLVNDFEKTVFEKHPELGRIKDSLYETGAVYASMSGSGSALFALYDKQ